MPRNGDTGVAGRVGRGAAPGKVILLGEHAVVYGHPAIALPIGQQIIVEVRHGATPVRRPEVTPPGQGRVPLALLLHHAGQRLGLDPSSLDITVAAGFPAGMGLGSSAALSVALMRALADFAGVRLSLAELCAHAFSLECLFHGRPSGVDNTTVAYATLLRFVRDQPPKPIAVRTPLPLAIVLGNQPRETRAVVERLRIQRKAHPNATERSFAAIAARVERAEAALVAGDLVALGQCMNENHELLRSLGVSSAELDFLVTEARRFGAYGAKLTGGGGGGGIVCLCPQRRDTLLRHFAVLGFRTFALDWNPLERGAHERHAVQQCTP